MSYPKAIVFDWDNTLVDSWTIIHDALNATFDDFGLPRWTLIETQKRVAKSMRDSFPALFGEEWKRAGDRFYSHFEAIHLERLTPLEGAIELLRELHDKGTYLALVSNKKGILLRKEAEHLGWASYFGAIIGAGDAAHDKPAPDPVEMALANSDIPLGPEVWFVGDMAVDIECALNSGCSPILIHAQALDTPHIPIHHVESLQMLSKLLKTL